MQSENLLFHSKYYVQGRKHTIRTINVKRKELIRSCNINLGVSTREKLEFHNFLIQWRGGYPPPFCKIVGSEWIWRPLLCLQSSFVLLLAPESTRIVLRLC